MFPFTERIQSFNSYNLYDWRIESSEFKKICLTGIRNSVKHFQGIL